MCHQESLARRRERAAAIAALVYGSMAGVLVGLLAWAVSGDAGVAVAVGCAALVLLLKVARWRDA